MLFDTIVRLVIIAIGFAFATMATVIALFFTLRGPIADASRTVGRAGHDLESFEAGFDAVMTLIEVFASLVGGMTQTIVLTVAFLAILAAEFLRIRSWIYHILAGGAAMGAAAAAQGPDLDLLDIALPGFVISLVSAGFVGGAVYWLLAGRRSGIRGLS